MDTSRLIKEIAERLASIAGVEAVVLGGSRARCTHTPASDVDLGIYYHPSAPLDLEALARLAKEIDDGRRPNLVTAIGGWGPWINGGGWLTVDGLAVDFIYRDLDKVSRVIAESCAGRFETVYQPGHPHAFVSYIYLSEAALCQPLWDVHGTIAQLKEKTWPYPPRLKQAIIDAFWWEADFSLKGAQKSASRGDVAYAAGCCFRCVACLAQTLFALNEQYWMNEKGAVAMAAKFSIAPAQLEERVEHAFAQLSGSPKAIAVGIKTLQGLLDETRPRI